MDIWKIYYQHWAKECNELRQRQFRKKSIQKTMEIITKKAKYNSWIKNKDIGFFIFYLRNVLNSFSNLEEKFQELKELSNILFPTQTPKDQDFLLFGFEDLIVVNDRLETQNYDFSFSPTEERFVRNCGTFHRAFIYSQKLSARTCFELDAILSLF